MTERDELDYVANFVSLKLEAIHVQLANVERKLDDLMDADRYLQQSVGALESRVRVLEISGASERAKLATIVGGVGILAGGAGSLLMRLLIG